MVLDEQVLFFNNLKQKSEYLKECLWRNFFKAKVARRETKTGRQRFLEQFRTC